MWLFIVHDQVSKKLNSLNWLINSSIRVNKGQNPWGIRVGFKTYLDFIKFDKKNI